MNYSIAIDGPAGSGKSTIADRLAKDMGFIHVNTGLMYRAVGYFCLREGLDPKDESRVMSQMADLDIEVEYDEGRERVFLNGNDVTDGLRDEKVGMVSSVVSKYSFVREMLVNIQQDIAKSNSVIMDGRDIATKVLPAAFIKVYLTASPEVRAERRLKEIEAKGEEASYKKILASIKARDYEDENRPISPLKKADDAVEIDTSHMSQDEAVEAILKLFHEKKELYERNHPC